MRRAGVARVSHIACTCCARGERDAHALLRDTFLRTSRLLSHLQFPSSQKKKKKKNSRGGGVGQGWGVGVGVSRDCWKTRQKGWGMGRGAVGWR